MSPPLQTKIFIFGTDWLRAHTRSQLVALTNCFFSLSCILSPFQYPVSVEPVVPIRKHTTINQLSLDPVPDFYDDLDFLDAGLDIFLSLYRLIKKTSSKYRPKPPPLPSLLLVLSLLPLLFKFLPSTACTLKYSANKRPIISHSTNLAIMSLI